MTLAGILANLPQTRRAAIFVYHQAAAIFVCRQAAIFVCLGAHAQSPAYVTRLINDVITRRRRSLFLLSAARGAPQRFALQVVCYTTITRAAWAR